MASFSQFNLRLNLCFTARNLRDFPSCAHIEPGLGWFRISTRQREVLQLLAEGKSMKEIANI